MSGETSAQRVKSRDGNVICVYNLNNSINGKCLKKFCSRFGDVKKAYVQRNCRTRRAVQGFVTFGSKEDALKALSADSRSLVLKGRKLAFRSSYYKDMKKEKFINNMPDRLAVVKAHPVLNGLILEKTLGMVRLIDLVRLSRVSRAWWNASHLVMRRMRQLDLSLFKERFTMFKSCTHKNRLTHDILRQLLAKTRKGLRRLDLTGCTGYLGGESLKLISRLCPNLVDINLSELTFKEGELVQFAKSCRKIEKLRIDDGIKSPTLRDQSCHLLLKELPNLTHLDIPINCRTKGKFLQGVGPNLQMLKLTGFDSVAMKHINELFRQCPRLNHLHLDSWDKYYGFVKISQSQLTQLRVGRGDLFQQNDFVFGNISVLKHIDVSDNFDISNKTLQMLGKAAPQLEVINLSNAGMKGDFPFNEFPFVDMPIFESLISRGPITDQGVADLPLLCLRELHLTQLNEVTDAVFARLWTAPNLSKVYLNNMSKITEAGVVGFIRGCKELTFLSVRGCEQVTKNCATVFLDEPARNSRLNLVLNIEDFSYQLREDLIKKNIEIDTNGVLRSCPDELSLSDTCCDFYTSASPGYEEILATDSKRVRRRKLSQRQPFSFFKALNRHVAQFFSDRHTFLNGPMIIDHFTPYLGLAHDYNLAQPLNGFANHNLLGDIFMEDSDADSVEEEPESESSDNSPGEVAADGANGEDNGQQAVQMVHDDVA